MCRSLASCLQSSPLLLAQGGVATNHWWYTEVINLLRFRIVFILRNVHVGAVRRRGLICACARSDGGFASLVSDVALSPHSSTQQNIAECTHVYKYLYSELRVPFPCVRDAEVAYNTLRVDPEPPRSEVSKCLQQDANMLIV